MSRGSFAISVAGIAKKDYNCCKMDVKGNFSVAEDRR